MPSGIDTPPASHQPFENVRKSPIARTRFVMPSVTVHRNRHRRCSPARSPWPTTRPREGPAAPADYQIVSSDRAGAYFVARPLKERYDRLVGQLATLRRDIAEARITSDEARRRVDQLSKELRGPQAADRAGQGLRPRRHVHQLQVHGLVPDRRG